MRVEEINKKYSERSILKNINLNFDKNGMVFILGASGSGKSTLLNTLGLLDDDFSGNLFYKDSESVKNEAQRTNLRKKHIAFIFQEYNLINSLSVRENIETAIDVSEGNFNKDEYGKIIEMFNLSELENRNVSTLSGGEKQRVAIARALLRNNEVIFADEPTGNLDEENSDIIFNALREVAKTHLVIIVSHNKEAAEKFADRIITIRDGVISDDSDKAYSGNSPLVLNDNRETNSKANKWIKKISLRSFHMRKKKLIPSMLAILISLLCVGIVCGIFSAIGAILDKANTDIIEADKIDVNALNVEDENFLPYSSIDEKFKEELRALPNVKDSVEYVDSYLYVDINGSEEFSYTEVIKNDDFFNERINVKYGRMINNDNEVLINEYAAKTLFKDEESAIGKKLPLCGIGNAEKPTIVGVRADMMPIEMLKITLTDKLSISLMRGNLDDEEHTQVGIVKKSEIKSETSTEVLDDGTEETSTVYSPSMIVVAKGVDSGFSSNIIYGRKPQSKDEVLLDINSFNNVTQWICENPEPQSKDDIKNGKVDQSLIDEILGEYSVTYGWSAVIADVKIVGICATEQESSDFPIIYVDKEARDTWCDNVADKVTLYLNDYSKESINEINELVKNENKGYSTTYNAEEMRNTFSALFTAIALGVSIIALIIIIVSCILVSFSTKSNISERTYEIGVLKSLGADKKSIFRMFGFENFVMGIIVSAAAILIFIILSLCGLSSWASISGISFYCFEWWHMIVIILVGLFITMISGIGKINKAAKMSVTDAIRTKNI